MKKFIALALATVMCVAVKHNNFSTHLNIFLFIPVNPI